MSHYYAIGIRPDQRTLALGVLTHSPYNTGFWTTGNCATVKCTEVAKLFTQFANFQLFDSEEDAMRAARMQMTELRLSDGMPSEPPNQLSSYETPIYRIFTDHTASYLKTSSSSIRHEVPADRLSRSVLISASFVKTKTRFNFGAHPGSYAHILRKGEAEDAVTNVTRLFGDYQNPDKFAFLGPALSRGLTGHWNRHQLLASQTTSQQLAGKAPTAARDLLITLYRELLSTAAINLEGSYAKRLAASIEYLDEHIATPTRVAEAARVAALDHY